MSTGKARSGLLVLMAALMASVGMSSARADVWYGSWDPLFGSPFTVGDGFAYDLGWGGGLGGAFFNTTVNAPCAVPLGGGDITNAGACGGAAAITSLQVRLYEFPNQTPVYNTLTFLVPGAIDLLRYGPTEKLEAIRSVAGVPGLSDWVYDAAPLAIGTAAGTDAEFAIQFVIDGSDCLFCGPGGFDPLNAGYSGPVLFARMPIDEGDSCEGEGLPYVCVGDYKVYRSNVNEFPAIVTFVPEPASIALFAAGLVAAGIAGRRRRAARP